MTNVQGRSTKGAMLRSTKGVHRKTTTPTGPISYVAVIDNQMEFRVEIDKVEVWEARPGAAPVLALPGQILKTMTIKDVFVFNDGLRFLLREGLAGDGNVRKSWRSMTERNPGSPPTFALDRRDKLTSPGAVSTNWKWPTTGIGGQLTDTTAVEMTQQFATTDGVEIAFDGAVGSGRDYAVADTLGDVNPQPVQLIHGVALTRSSTISSSPSATLFGIEFSDTPGTTTLINDTSSVMNFHIYGRIFIEALD